jgi:hypothetical protein
MNIRRFAVLGVVGLTVAAGCLDVDPTPFHPRDAGTKPFDANIDDVSPDVDPLERCLACIKSANDPGPGCLTEWTACENVPLCHTTIECALPLNCLALGDQFAVLTCGLPCATEAGVTDPIQQLGEVYGLVVCVLNNGCRTECGAPPL